ncbi:MULTISPECIES: hypothetical protein [Nocardia]|uniref:hypothetical protein n=1 Tax=Nocardia TaxID=1817 RepID=UPI00105E9AF4|nr:MULTISPECIES: hypothetical protein [Nocardia]MBC7299714.1 hypothetical protein [Nocardia sp.]
MQSGHRGVAVRVGLARLIAVLAALVGLAMMQTSPCADQVRAFGHDLRCPTAGLAANAVTDGDAAATSTSEVVGHFEAAADLLGGAMLDPVAPVGALGLCLVLLLSVLLAVTWPARTRPILLAPARAGPHPVIIQRRCHAPSLAMLCVLRT